MFGVGRRFKVRKRHKTSHLDFDYCLLRTRRPGVRISPGAPLFLVVELGNGTMLFSRLTWMVRELERRALEFLPDSHLPAYKSGVLHLYGCEKSGGRLVFSTGVAGCNSNRDEVGS